MNKQAVQALNITGIAMNCATQLSGILRDKTGKHWVVTVRKAEYLDFQLLITLTHWQVITPYGDNLTHYATLDIWSDGIISQWKRDMQEMAA